MSINAQHFRDYVVRPTLEYLDEADPGINSPAAEELLMLTAAVESNLGEYLHQVGGGPAQGPFQVEPNTEVLIREWLERRPHLSDLGTHVTVLHNPLFKEASLIYNCALARCLYRSIFVPLPNSTDVKGMAEYHLRWFNNGGKSEVEKTIEAYERLVLDGS